MHHREDEAFWILDGDVSFEVDGTIIEAHVGDYAFGPRSIPHCYTVGDAGCRMLFILTPGGFEEMVIEMSVPAASRTLPLPPTEEPDWARIAAIVYSTRLGRYCSASARCAGPIWSACARSAIVRASLSTRW
ncbi:cupin domain-containing protein [Candidatus Gracilibacteria bacterium]|nr:cupin domain-containing protein [Candidatus Gracilibacteria bacterium]